MNGLTPTTGRTGGDISKAEIPLGRYLSAQAEQGWHDGAFASIMRLEEWRINNTGPILSPTEANAKYSVPGLTFTDPISEERAKIRKERHQDANRRAFYIEQGAPGLASKRGLAGLGVSMIASVLNPVDLPLAVFPITGSAKLARAGSISGRGKFRQALARGLITEEYLATKTAHPKLLATVIEGMGSQAVLEIPLFVSNRQSALPYTVDNSLVNIAAAGTLSAGAYAAFKGASNLYRRLQAGTRRRLWERKLNDFLRDRETPIDDLVSTDPAVLRERVAFDETAARLEAEKAVNHELIRQGIKGKHQEWPVAATIRWQDADGVWHVEKAPAHKLIPEYATASEYPTFEEGFVTQSGRFIDHDTAFLLGGFKRRGKVGLKEDGSPELEWAGSEDFEFGGLVMNDQFPPTDEIYVSAVRELVRAERAKGTSEPEIVNLVREELRKNADDFFFSQPDIQAKIAVEEQKAIESAIAEKRKQHEQAEATKQAEIEQRIQQTRVLSPEEVQKWQGQAGADPKDVALIDEELADLRKELDAVEKVAEVDRVEAALDKAIKALEQPKGLFADPFLIQALGRPALRGLLQIIRLAYKELKNLDKAITRGIQWLEEKHPKKFKELGISSEGSSRRDFLGQLSAAFGGLGLAKLGKLEPLLQAAKTLPNLSLDSLSKIGHILTELTGENPLAWVHRDITRRRSGAWKRALTLIENEKEDLVPFMLSQENVLISSSGNLFLKTQGDREQLHQQILEAAEGNKKVKKVLDNNEVDTFSGELGEEQGGYSENLISDLMDTLGFKKTTVQFDVDFDFLQFTPDTYRAFFKTPVGKIVYKQLSEQLADVAVEKLLFSTRSIDDVLTDMKNRKYIPTEDVPLSSVERQFKPDQDVVDQLADAITQLEQQPGWKAVINNPKKLKEVSFAMRRPMLRRTGVKTITDQLDHVDQVAAMLRKHGLDPNGTFLARYGQQTKELIDKLALPISNKTAPQAIDQMVQQRLKWAEEGQDLSAFKKVEKASDKPLTVEQMLTDFENVKKKLAEAKPEPEAEPELKPEADPKVKQPISDDLSPPDIKKALKAEIKAAIDDLMLTTEHAFEMGKLSGETAFSKDSSGFHVASKSAKDVVHHVTSDWGEYAELTEATWRWSHLYDQRGNPLDMDIDVAVKEHGIVHVMNNSGEHTQIVTFDGRKDPLFDPNGAAARERQNFELQRKEPSVKEVDEAIACILAKL